MRLAKARVTKYRSVRDSEEFEIENHKTILVGSNEAGKSALLYAIQQLNPPEGVAGFDPLRDYPRSEYNDISKGKVKPSTVKVVEGTFILEDGDKAVIDASFHESRLIVWKNLDNSGGFRLEGGPEIPKYGSIEKGLAILAGHLDSRVPAPAEGAAADDEKPGDKLKKVIAKMTAETLVTGPLAKSLDDWLAEELRYLDDKDLAQVERYDSIRKATRVSGGAAKAIEALKPRLPVFVLFSNYFRVRPLIHLEHLATRLESNVMDDAEYDYGNQCLLKLLGFTARELSNLGKATEPAQGQKDALKAYRDQLDNRSYQLNAASVRLTGEIRNVWLPDQARGEADKVLIRADGQYLKAVVEDDLGVEIELNQRSEGFQWLVSFFVVFFAEAVDKHQNAILLLDEPGLSLHGLKQRDFRITISNLAAKNQTLYTTHSPFLVGPDELDMVRVVEMKDRKIGTKVHTTVTSEVPASLLPLQEALGYDLAQSLFAQQKNLVLEGLTDYWYLEATAALLRESGEADLDEKIALVIASNAGKVVYYATILHAQKLQVAALLDSDAAGDQAAKQETLVHTLGNKRILRTKDVYTGAVKTPEVEDLLRETLVKIAKADLGWDVTKEAATQAGRAVVDIFATINGFSKYKLAKAFLRWTRAGKAGDLTADERAQWKALIERINAALS